MTATDATTRANAIMETASQALVAMDYIGCERGCLEAMAIARDAGLWSLYARILNPLQEARRFRRQTALDGPVRLGGDLADAQTSQATCLAINADPEAIRGFADAAHEAGRYVEVLRVEPQGDTWQVHALPGGPAVRALMPAPPEAWQGHDLEPNVRASGETACVGELRLTRPADWFVAASEALGDTAIAEVGSPLGSTQRVHDLEARLQVVADHEKLHQALAAAAQAAARA